MIPLSTIPTIVPLPVAPETPPVVMVSPIANPDVSPFFAEHVNYPHSVLTQHLIDDAGEPTIAAREEILELLRQRLRPEADQALSDDSDKASDYEQ